MSDLVLTSEAFPTGPHKWEVVLSGYELLSLLLITVPKICVVLIAQVNTQALFGVTDRPVDRKGQSGGLFREVSHSLRVFQKAFVSEDIGVRKGGDNDVQRLAAVWGLMVSVLHPKKRQRLSFESRRRHWNVASHRGTFHR